MHESLVLRCFLFGNKNLSFYSLKKFISLENQRIFSLQKWRSCKKVFVTKSSFFNALKFSCFQFWKKGLILLLCSNLPSMCVCVCEERDREYVSACVVWVRVVVKVCVFARMCVCLREWVCGALGCRKVCVFSCVCVVYVS